MKMTNADLEQRIAKGMSKLTPKDVQKVWEKPVEVAQGNEWYLDGTKTKKKNSGKIISIVSAVAACCLICFLSFYMTNLRAEATIYFDVNPSVQLQVNQRDKVISAKAGNPEGKIILENMDLKYTELDVAVNALLGSMIKHGYLDEAKRVILCSVESRDLQKGEQLSRKLKGEIHGCLDPLLGSAVVWNQEIQVDKEIEELSKTYGVSPGKAYLLRKIISQYHKMEYETLAAMSMTELSEYLEEEEQEKFTEQQEAEKERVEAEQEQLEAEQEWLEAEQEQLEAEQEASEEVEEQVLEKKTEEEESEEWEGEGDEEEEED